ARTVPPVTVAPAMARARSSPRRLSIPCVASRLDRCEAAMAAAPFRRSAGWLSTTSGSSGRAGGRESENPIVQKVSVKLCVRLRNGQPVYGGRFRAYHLDFKPNRVNFIEHCALTSCRRRLEDLMN